METPTVTFEEKSSNCSLLSKLTVDVRSFLEEKGLSDTVIDFLESELQWNGVRELCVIKSIESEEKHFSYSVQLNGAGHRGVTVVVVPLNDLSRINKFLENLNREFPEGRILITNFESLQQRRNKINRTPNPIRRVVSHTSDFVIHRVLPRLKFTQSFYFWLTSGRKRVLTITEALGRMVSCGYSIFDHQNIDGQTWVIASKNEDPKYDMNPTYGMFCTLDRVGFGGKMIKVYKLRTMHPYAEYIQEYVFDHLGTIDGDKVQNDFRVTAWGSFFRKYWIDELPMLWNWVKGDLKLVGIRPLSQHKFSMYPDDLKELRTQTKPGLVPPYYADLPQSQEEFFEVERRYLQSYFENPLLTDFRYFYLAMTNIFFRNARSM